MMKPIPGWPDYFATDKGEIISNKPVNQSGKGRRLKRITGQLSNGRRMVLLYPPFGSGKKRKMFTVSCLILITFVGPRPSQKHMACHGPAGVGDDSLANLYWATADINNGRDRLRDGKLPMGESHKLAKLNNLSVRVIRRSYEIGKDCGITQQYLADLYGVSQMIISRTILRKGWKHVA